MKTAIILISLLLAVSTSHAAEKVENENPNTTERTEKTEKHEKGSEQRPFVVRTLPAPKDAEETKRNEKDRTKKFYLDVTNTVSTIFLVLVTTALAAFTAYLWDATRKLAKETKVSNERQLRAYVNVLQGKVFYPNDPANRIFRIDIKNFGQTPAHNLSVVYKCVIREFPLDKSKTLEVTDSEHGYFSVLAPTCIYRQDTAAPINGAWAESKLIDGTAAIYCYGEIKYRDAFDNDQTTKFRYMCRGEGMANGDVSPCEEGNYAT